MDASHSTARDVTSFVFLVIDCVSRNTSGSTVEKSSADASALDSAAQQRNSRAHPGGNCLAGLRLFPQKGATPAFTFVNEP